MNPEVAPFEVFRVPDVHLRPLVLWHLLSMDAPTVALCWTIFVGAITRTRLPIASGAAMWLAVWVLYAADRLMDTRGLRACGRNETATLEYRHLFHYQHRRLFGAGIAVSLVCLGALLPRFPAASLQLYALEGVFTAVYFVLIHRGPSSSESCESGRRRRYVRLPKELLVGPFFAAAVFIPTVARRPELRLELLPLALLFAGLCSLNCLYIFAWEHPKRSLTPLGTAWVLARLETFVWIFVAVSLAMCLPLGDAAWWPASFRLCAFVCASSGIALAGFDRFGTGMSKTALRVTADACLLTPLLALPFLRAL